MSISNNISIKSEINDGEVEYDEFPLMACPPEELEETRYHILKFHSNKIIDPLKDFEPPVRLHRKDPKNLQFQMSLKELEQKKIADQEKELKQKRLREEYLKRTGKTGLTDAEIDDEILADGLEGEERKHFDERRQREREIREREEERERQMQLVAPDGGARKPKKNVLVKRTQQVRVYNEKKRKLRYEEFYPWVLEDYDAKQAWVSNYEAGLHDNYCMLIMDPITKSYKLAPVEKCYKFTSRNKYATLTLEEAEAKMKQGNSGQRWLMRKMMDEVATGKRVDLRYRKSVQVKTEVEEDDDEKRSDEDEDLDFDDEFQDDEEAPIMEGPDEEKKLIETKLKKEMLSANNLIEKVADEEEDDDLDDLFEVKKEDKESKKLRKALSKNAMNEVYASDDDEDENPYLSNSDIESEEDESKGEMDNTIKVKTEEEDEIKVKEEDTDELSGVSKAKKEKSKNIYVEKFVSGFLTLKGKKEILLQFPKGEWNPRTAIRRDLTDTNVSTSLIEDKATVNDDESTTLKREDIDALLVNGPIELSTLVRSLKSKMQRDPNSKNTIKELLKDHFIVKNKQVWRKETA